MLTGRQKMAVAAVSLAVALTGCSGTPEHVIPQDEMAELLADMYTAETIVDINRSTYRTDSMKKVMKQSVFMKHGVTAEQVDTSFDWYGHHISEYIEVYDKAIKILEKNVAQASATNAAFGVVGDSVDTWQWSRHYALTPKSPQRVLTFELPKDENWQKGDVYSWAMKSFNNRASMSWGLSAEYPDGKIEYSQADINGEGWNKLKYISDSTQVPLRIAGYVIATEKEGNENVYLDSISLIRDRVKPGLYHQRYRQRTIEGNVVALKSRRDESTSRPDTIDNVEQPPVEPGKKISPLRERRLAR